jgi:hypothetical protein
MKIIHYAIIEMYVQDSEEKKEKENRLNIPELV